MMRTASVLRRAEENALARVMISGSVLDLGGDAKSHYRTLFKGSPSFTTVNVDPNAKPDIVHDLEKPLPLKDASYDGVLLINVLEHVFEYRMLLSEAARVLKPDGTLVVVVPFLFPVHPSPADYHRFTAGALRKECERIGLSQISIAALGSGMFSARYLMLERLLPRTVQIVLGFTARSVVLALDWLLVRVARTTGRSYDPADYALGYLLTAQK